MKPDEMFAVRMSTAEWYSFARQHPEAAKLLFEKAALRQTEHMNKPGLDHKLKLLVNEGGYRDRVRDAKAVHAMAKDYDWTTPQKRMPPVVNVPYDPNAPTYESSIAGALKQRAAQQSKDYDRSTPQQKQALTAEREAFEKKAYGILQKQAKSYEPGVHAAVRTAYKPKGLGATYDASDAADLADPSFPFPQKTQRRQKTAAKGMSL